MSKKSVAKVVSEALTISDEQLRMQQDAIAKLHDGKLVYISADAVLRSAKDDWNPGNRKPDDYTALLPSIRATGQKEPIVVALRKGKVADAEKADLHLLRGYLRKDCIGYFQGSEELQAEFKALYPKGVPTLVVEGLTEDQEYFLACDHDTVGRSEWAIIEQAVAMFRAGYTEKGVAVALHAELSSTFGLKADKKQEIANAKTKADAEKLIHEYWRQRTQEWKAITRLPKEAFEGYKNHKTGVKDGPTLTGKQIKALDSANKDGTATKPTNEYTNLIQSYFIENASGVAGPKPIAQSKMKENYKALASKTFQIFQMKDALDLKVDLTELDAQLKALEEAGTLIVSKTISDTIEANHEVMVPKTKKTKTE
jgi:hypothetical protein